MKSPTDTPTAVDSSRVKALLSAQNSSLRTVVASIPLIGKELYFIRPLFGIKHGGARPPQAKTQVAFLEPSAADKWAEFCQRDLGISHDTAERYIKCFEVVKGRAKNNPETLRLLATPSEKLKCDELAALAARAGQLVCDDTESSLIREFRKLGKQSRGNKPSKGDQEKADRAKVQKTADLIFGGIDDSFKRFKADVRSAFKKSLGEAVRGGIPAEPEEGAPLSLVQIRDDIKAKVQDVETDLNALVRSMDKQIEKFRRAKADQCKQLTKSK